MKTNNQALILEGNMTKAIWIISIPIILNNLIQTIYNLVDGFFLGKLGATEFAATTFVWPLLYFFVALGAGASIAGTSIMSQLIGANKKEEASSYAFQLISVSLIFALILASLGYFVSPLMVRGMGGAGKLQNFSNTYLSITFLGYPAVVMTFVISAIQQSQGNTRAITISSVTGALTNIILDPFFIFERVPVLNLPGLGLGVSGAALATIISQYINMTIGTLLVKSNKEILDVKIKGEKLEKEKIKKLIKIGIPSMVGQSSAALGFVILNAFIVDYGTATLAAYGVVNRITGLLTQPTMGFGAAIPSIIGQNVGAKNQRRVKECFLKSHKLSLILSLIGAVGMYLFRKELVLAFIKAEEAASILPDANEYMIYSLLIIPLMGMFSIFHGFFQGTGHTKYGMHMSMGRLWILRIPMIYLFKNFTLLGASGIWMSMLLSNLLVNVYAFWVYFKGKWKTSILNN